MWCWAWQQRVTKKSWVLPSGQTKPASYGWGYWTTCITGAWRMYCSSAWTACQILKRPYRRYFPKQRYKDASSTCCAIPSNMSVTKTWRNLPLGRRQLLLPILGWHPPDHVHHEHHRRAEPPVPESDQDKERVSKWYIFGKDAVPGKPKCNKEMYPKIPKLGPDSEPANYSVWEQLTEYL